MSTELLAFSYGAKFKTSLPLRPIAERGGCRLRSFHFPTGYPYYLLSYFQILRRACLVIIYGDEPKASPTPCRHFCQSGPLWGGWRGELYLRSDNGEVVDSEAVTAIYSANLSLLSFSNSKFDLVFLSSLKYSHCH